MSREDHVRNLIVNSTRRLQKLEEQQAYFGIHTPAHILTEIEDTEKKIEELNKELAGIRLNGNARSDLIQVNYEFINSRYPLYNDAFVKALLTFSDNKDVIHPKTKHFPIHLCLLLDVSGSMNTKEKYPLLLEAIPYLVNALHDDDYLSIILFSVGSDIVLYPEPINSCREKIDTILSQIDQSGTKFGPHTLLFSALQDSIEIINQFRVTKSRFINRMYILTDGQLHDEEDCCTLNQHLRTMETEINSYGFGSDFALNAIKQITNDIPGSGKVTSILNTRDIKSVFSHVGRIAQRVIAGDADITFTFAKDVIAGDAFIYSPNHKYFPNNGSKEFKYKLGSLESNRIYTFLFEGRMPALTEPPHGLQDSSYLLRADASFGEITLRYRVGATWEQVTRSIVVRRASDSPEQTNRRAMEIYQILHSLRENDLEAQINALRAKIAIYEREGRDIETISVAKHSLQKLESGVELSEEEIRASRAQSQTISRYQLDGPNIINSDSTIGSSEV